MTAIKSRLKNFDDEVSRLLKANNNSELISFLLDVILKQADIVLNRKYSIRNLLIANIEVFKGIFLELDAHGKQRDFVKPVSKAINSSSLNRLEKIFQNRMESASIKYTRIDGRRRLFVSNEDIRSQEAVCIDELLNNVLQKSESYELKTILFEEINPIDLPFVQTSYWHIDCLKDQLKILIPLDDITANNAPMRYLSRYKNLADYPSSIWRKLHTIFKISGLSVSKANYFEDDIAEDGCIEHLTMSLGDIAIFNPKMIHTGTLCQSGSRRTMTLYLDMQTSLNNCFSRLF